MPENRKTKNIFADKATLIARRMLSCPDEKWVVRDFNGPHGISLGMAQEVLEAMKKRGYVERVKKGPHSYTILTHKDNLINDWLNAYGFDLNRVYTYYSPDQDILKKIISCLKEDQYALTLHTGANFITSRINTEELFIYLQLNDWPTEVSDLRQRLDLKELVQGGNVHFIRPHYKKSVFFGIQEIKGYRIVSNLQLYLDLYNFHPNGREHAEHLKHLLAEKGKAIG